MALKITKENFQDEVLQSSEPVLIDFWAEWCSPCRMLAPIVDEIAEESNGIKIGKINVDEERELALKFSVNSIPMLVLFKDGKSVAQTVGVQSKEEILKMIEAHNGN